MLKMISWSEYFSIMAVFYGLYFGWWLLKYYPGLKGMKLPALGQKRSGTADSKEPRTAGSAHSGDEGPGEDLPDLAQQPEGSSFPGEDCSADRRGTDEGRFHPVDAAGVSK